MHAPLSEVEVKLFINWIGMEDNEGVDWIEYGKSVSPEKLSAVISHQKGTLEPLS